MTNRIARHYKEGTWTWYAFDDEQKKSLDDGQEWYTPTDRVEITGYLPDHREENPAFTLIVNQQNACDNWIHWSDMPEWLRTALTDLSTNEQKTQNKTR